MRAWFFIALLLSAFHALAQQDIQIPEAEDAGGVTDDKDSVRRYYIKRFPDYFFLYPVLKQRGLNFELARADRSALLTYKPNNTYNLGLGVYLFELVLEFGFAIPLNEKSFERFGESDARDLQLNVMAKRWGVDIYHQRYKGFFLTDREFEPAPDEPFPQRPDIKTKNIGLTAHYIFNPEKFSFRAAYNFVERQLYSKGSFLLFSSVNAFEVKADSSLVSHGREDDFDPGVDFTSLRYTTFSLSPGYTYNLTYKHFFLNGTLSFGPAHHWVRYQLEGSAREHHDTEINTFIAARVAVGYNGYRMFGGLSFISQGNTLDFNNARFSNNNGVFKVVMGYRFNETGILKKRVWDILPF